jgi:hypothetical protein
VSHGARLLYTTQNDWCWTAIPTIRAVRLGEFSVPKSKLTRNAELWGKGIQTIPRSVRERHARAARASAGTVENLIVMRDWFRTY